MTTHRADWKQLEAAAAEVIAGLRAVNGAVERAGLDAGLVELVKIRVSQLNGCAYCLQFHTNLARKLQVEQAKLDQLSAWREASVYSAAEYAALDWAESLTRMLVGPIDEAVWQALQPHFDEAQCILLTAAIGQITAWNRIAGGLNIAPPPAR